jgi:hypothetical protein
LEVARPLQSFRTASVETGRTNRAGVAAAQRTARNAGFRRSRHLGVGHRLGLEQVYDLLILLRRLLQHQRPLPAGHDGPAASRAGRWVLVMPIYEKAPHSVAHLDSLSIEIDETLREIEQLGVHIIGKRPPRRRTQISVGPSAAPGVRLGDQPLTISPFDGFYCQSARRAAPLSGKAATGLFAEKVPTGKVNCDRC